MKIGLGQKGDYAIRAVLALTEADGRRKAREIASQMAIPENFLPQILGSLVRAGIVTSLAGPDGGYTLARDAAKISMLDVIEAAEGPIRSERCVLRGGPCHWDNACAVHPAWFAAQDALIARLRETSFAQLGWEDEHLRRVRTRKPASAGKARTRRSR